MLKKLGAFMMVTHNSKILLHIVAGIISLYAIVGPDTVLAVPLESPLGDSLSLPQIAKESHAGPTRKGTVAFEALFNVTVPVLFMAFSVQGFFPDPHMICDVNHCLWGASKGKRAYQVFADPSARPQTIAHIFLASRAGGRCFLFCNRFSFYNVHHIGFVRKFLQNFGPEDPSQSSNLQAILLFAAFLNMRPIGPWGDETFLFRFLRNIHDDANFCEYNARCTAVMKGLRIYVRALERGKISGKYLVSASDVQ